MDGFKQMIPVIAGHDRDSTFGGGYLFALVLIFLAVMMVFMRKHGDEYKHHESKDSFKDILGALMIGKLGKESPEPCYSSHLAVKQAEDTGKIIHNTDVQEEKTRKEIGEAAKQQERLAREASDSQKNLEIQKLLAENTELKTMGAMAVLKGTLESKMDNQFSQLHHLIEKLGGKMLTKPPVWPMVGVPTMAP